MRRSVVLVSLLAAGLAGCKTTSATAPDVVGPGGGQPDGPAPGDGEAPAASMPAFPAEAFRAAQPAPTAERPFQLPAITRFAMGPAIDVYLMENHDLPVVSLELNLEGGGMNDPAGKVGLASMCMNMLTEGTQRLDKIAYSEALADIASSISAYAGNDRQGVSMSALKRNFPATFALWAETITSPGLRPSDFDRMVKRSLESLKQAKASPGSIHGRVFGAVLYGLRHPLGRVTTEATLSALTLDDCKKYHAAYLKPKGARLFVTGDITRAELEQAFAPLLASWKGAPRKSVAMKKPAAPSGKIFFVHVAGAPQASVALLHLGPPRTSPKYFANDLMAQVLGGGFAGRINMNLREDKGYSYGARGGFGYNRFFGSFSASSSVRTDSAAQSIVELYEEVHGLKDGSKPPKAEELDREKNGAILGLPAGFATSRQTLGMFRSLVYYGLPLDYYATYVDKVKAVTLEDVAAAAARELKPGQASILVVGDGDALQITNIPPGDDPSASDKKVNPPMLGQDGQQLTLRQALVEMAAAGKFGKGALVELDADGQVVKPAKK
jgi:zinc protease